MTRQDRAAVARVALRQRYDDRVRYPPGREVPRRHDADGEDVCFGAPHPQSGVRNQQLSQFNRITATEARTPRSVSPPGGPTSCSPSSSSSRSCRSAMSSASATRNSISSRWGAAPIGWSGWQRGVRAALKANGTTGAAGPLPRVEFQPVPDASTRVADLRSGRADLARSLDSDEGAVSRTTRTCGSCRPRPNARLPVRHHAVGADTGHPRPPGDRHALDRGLIVEALLGGYERPVDIC